MRPSATPGTRRHARSRRLPGRCGCRCGAACGHAPLGPRGQRPRRPLHRQLAPTQERITRFYGRESEIVHPPVDTPRFQPGEPGEHLLIVSELVATSGCTSRWRRRGARGRRSASRLGPGPRALAGRPRGRVPRARRATPTSSAFTQRPRGDRREQGGVRHHRGRGAGRRAAGDRRGRRRGTRDRARRRPVGSWRSDDVEPSAPRSGARSPRLRPRRGGPERRALLGRGLQARAWRTGRRRARRATLSRPSRVRGERRATAITPHGTTADPQEIVGSPPMTSRHLHIAWLGAGPSAKESGGVPGVARELVEGLAAQGHRIDIFLPSAVRELPPHLRDLTNMTFVRGTSEWRYDRWYNRGTIAIFLSGLLARALGSLRLRREVLRRHRREPYDVLYQYSNIESLAVPARLRGRVPLVIHPETHIAGELRYMWRERRLALRCQSKRSFAAVAAPMALRAGRPALPGQPRGPADLHQRRLSRSHPPRLRLPARAHRRHPQPDPLRALHSTGARPRRRAPRRSCWCWAGSRPARGSTT